MESQLAESLRESKTSLVEVFRNTGLRRLNLALAGSVMGDWAYAVAVSVYAWGQGGATAVGVYGVARYVSMALAAPFVSVLADRMDRKRLMVAVDVLRAALVAAAALVIAADGPAMAVYGLGLVTSLAGTAFRPAQMALLPNLARHPAELTAANVTASTVEAVGSFVGPAVAGGLLALTEVAVVFGFNAATFVWSAVLVGLLPRPGAAALVDPTDETDGPAGTDAADDEDDRPTPRNPFAGAGAGFAAIFGSRDLSVLVGLYCLQTVVAGASAVFEVAIVFDLLGMAESSVGVIDAVMGVGGLVGGFVALVLAMRGRLALDFGLGLFLWSAPLLLVAVVPELVPVLLAMSLLGLGNSLVDINAFTIIQRLVPDEVMGRVFGATESALIAGMAVGSLLMPILINTVGLRTGLAVIGGAVAVAALLSLRSLRRIDLVALAPQGRELLASIPLLAPLPDRAIERLARAAEVVEVAAGETVFRQGEVGDRFYVVETGRADVEIDGAHETTVEAGGCFGEIALLRDAPRAATVTARTDLTLRAIPRGTFLRVVTADQDAFANADRLVTDMLVGSNR